MKLGRDFTNLLNTSFLSASQRQDLQTGKLTVADMDAQVQIKAKRDIVNQLRVAREIGLDHIELDGGVPNPFLELTEAEIARARDESRKLGLTMSLHLPYTFVGAATASFQESDRQCAVEMMKRYLLVAKNLGCNNVNMHPGAVPFYQAVGRYRQMVIESAIKSVSEIARTAGTLGLKMHLENNTAFDGVAYEIEECLEIIRQVNKSSHTDVKFCFDIGHWFTRADIGQKIPEPPEEIFASIPAELLTGQIHLNDYIPVVKKFHPPLHYQKGLLKRENLVRLFKMFKEKGVELVVVETAVREIDELLNARELMAEEQKYLDDIRKEISE